MHFLCIFLRILSITVTSHLWIAICIYVPRITHFVATVCTLRLLLLLLNNRMWELLSIITTVIIFILQDFMHKTCEMHWIFFTLGIVSKVEQENLQCTICMCKMVLKCQSRSKIEEIDGTRTGKTCIFS